MQSNMSGLMRSLASVDKRFNSDMRRAICDCSTTEQIAAIEKEHAERVRTILNICPDCHQLLHCCDCD